MINLFEYYNQPTQLLHQTLEQADYHNFTICIEDDGFLPDEVTSLINSLRLIYYMMTINLNSLMLLTSHHFGKLVAMDNQLKLKIWDILKAKYVTARIIKRA